MKLSDEVGIKQAAAQLGVAYYTLSEWRQKRKAYGDHAFAGSGIRRDAPLNENERRLMKKMPNCEKLMRFSRTPSFFSQKTGRSKSRTAL